MEYLFEPFSTGSHKGREGGHGLGLWVTYQIAHAARRRHHGRQRARRHALFRAHSHAAASHMKTDAMTLPGRRRPHHGRVAVPIASSWKASSSTGSATQPRPMERIGRVPYAVVISDIRLPGIDGGEMFARVAAAPRRRCRPSSSSPATASIDRAVQLLKLGAADYITKPFDLENLIEKIEDLARAHAPQAAAEAARLGVSQAMRRIEEMLPRTRQAREHDPDHRRIRRRQGTRGAGTAPPGAGRRAMPLRRGELRRHQREPDGGRAVRPREGRLHRRRRVPRRGTSSRPMAARCSSTKSARCRWRCRSSCCARSRSGASCASAARRRSR